MLKFWVLFLIQSQHREKKIIHNVKLRRYTGIILWKDFLNRLLSHQASVFLSFNSSKFRGGGERRKSGDKISRLQNVQRSRYDFSYQLSLRVFSLKNRRNISKRRKTSLHIFTAPRITTSKRGIFLSEKIKKNRAEKRRKKSKQKYQKNIHT